MTKPEPITNSDTTNLGPGEQITSVDLRSLPPGTAIAGGRYVIERLLGEGGMGVVLLARDTQLDRPVALKLPKLERHESMLKRFYREARAAATLQHPNICPIHDVGESDGHPFLAMAYVEGQPLSALIASGKRIPERWAAFVIRKLALALHEAHHKGVIHRDIKPANVMIDRRKEPVLMDFGLARGFGDDPRVAHDGRGVGSPAYMSPEQVRGEELGPPTDIYSLGVTLYETLAGRVPFTGTAMSVSIEIATEDEPPIEEFRPEVSAALSKICARAMAKKPRDRYGSMKGLANALTGFIKGGERRREQYAVTGEAARAKVPACPQDVWVDLDRRRPHHSKRRKAKVPEGDDRSIVWLAAAGVVLALLFAIGAWLFSGDGDAAEPPPAPSAVSP